MAPVAQPKRKKNENQYLFDLGVRGRKTGLTLPDTGVRDENGLEPMDGLFSSPAKSTKGKTPNGYPNRTLSSEEDMDMGGSTIPEPEDVLEQRASFRLPPRSNSPIKTFLQSPARKNPSFGGGVFSPNRGSTALPRTASVSASVRRRLDFSTNEDDSSESSIAPNKRAKSTLPHTDAARLTSATRLAPSGLRQSVDLEESMEESREEEYTAELEEEDTRILDAEDSMQMVDVGQDDEPEIESDQAEEEQEVEEEQESEPEPEPEPKVRPSKKDKRKAVVEEEEEQDPTPEPLPSKKGKRKAAETELEEPVKKARGRPKKTEAPVIQQEEEEEAPRPAKRTRRSLDQAPQPVTEPAKKVKAARPKKVVEPEPEPEPEQEESEPEQEPEPEQPQKKAGRKKGSEPDPAKKGPGKAPKTASNASKAKKPKLASIPEANSPEVKRGPPLPRSNQGLVILRRENPDEGGAGFKQTRSGRNSIKPLAYWKNERIEYSEDENEDHWGKFMLPRIKEVVRADEIEPQKYSRATGRSKSKSKKRRVAPIEEEEEELSEPWETENGKIYGSVMDWDPADPTGAETEEREDEIALSNAAIITRDVGNSSFKFAKTHTLPFFGSGMVDLPPGAAKKPKNSRKMQMVFFVFYGRVKVTVNETEFRIGKGGLWQVPRGNFYSIENDYDAPARIFFAQGCEVSENADESQLR